MANIKVSELPTATSFDDDDYMMIVQSNTNKKITKQNMFIRDFYTTTETIIGKWKDSKPIYRKVIEFSNALTNGTNLIAHNISNLDNIITAKGYALLNDNHYIFSAFESNNNFINIKNVNSTNVIIQVGNGWSSSFTNGGIIILEYTKSTD